jgi:hypothetical protein
MVEIERRKLDGSDVCAVYFSGDGALKKVDRDYETKTSAGTDENTFKVSQRAGLQSHPLSNAKIGVRLTQRTGLHNRLNCLNFGVRNRGWFSPKPNDVLNVRSRKHREPV